MSQRIISIKEVTHTTSLSRSSIYAKINEGTFPKPIHISERRIGWPESVISEWVEAQIQKAA